MFKKLKDMQELLDEIKYLDRLFSDTGEDENGEEVENEIFEKLDKLFLKFDYTFFQHEKEEVYKAIGTILDRADIPTLYSIAVLFLFFLQRPGLQRHFISYIEKKFKNKEAANHDETTHQTKKI